MSNDYFDSADYTALVRLTEARAEAVNSVFAAITVGFDVLPSAAYIKEGRINFAVDTGAADHYIVDQNVRPSGYTSGLFVPFVALAANTGACDINVKGSSGSLLGVKSIKRPDGTDPAAGDIPAGAVILLWYYGSTFQILAPISAAALAAQTAAAASAVAAAASASAALSSQGAAATSAAAALVSETAAAASAVAAAASAAAAGHIYLGVVTGSGDAMVSSFALAAYAAGIQIEFIAPGTNTVTAPTLNINSLGLVTYKDADGNALIAGSIASGRRYIGTFTSTSLVRLTDTDISQTAAQTGTDNVARMTALRVNQAISTLVPAASTSTSGIQANATQAQVNTGTATTKTVTPDVLANKSFTVYPADRTGVAGDFSAMDCSSSARSYTPLASPTVGDTHHVAKIGINLLSIVFGATNKAQLPDGTFASGTHIIPGPYTGVVRMEYLGTIADGTTNVWRVTT